MYDSAVCNWICCGSSWGQQFMKSVIYSSTCSARILLVSQYFCFLKLSAPRNHSDYTDDSLKSILEPTFGWTILFLFKIVYVPQVFLVVVKVLCDLSQGNIPSEVCPGSLLWCVNEEISWFLRSVVMTRLGWPKLLFRVTTPGWEFLGIFETIEKYPWGLSFVC